MPEIHNIENINFSGDSMFLRIDGKDYEFELKKHSKKLFNASQIEKENYIISPAGYGIHWPLIDEDLSIDGLLGILHKPELKRKSA